MNITKVSIMACFLVACGSENTQVLVSDDSDAPPDAAAQDAAFDEAAAEYQKKVQEKTQKKFGNAMVSAMQEDWNISEDQALCIYEDIPMEKLELGTSDPEIHAVFVACGVDPEVANPKNE
jgi:hypothetical protein